MSDEYYPLSHCRSFFTPSPLGRPSCEPEIVLEYVLLVPQSGIWHGGTSSRHAGTDELISLKGGANDQRVRVHTTSGNACSVLQLVDDRDETADVNFGLAVLNYVRGYAWPSYLCSPCSATT